MQQWYTGSHARCVTAVSLYSMSRVISLIHDMHCLLDAHNVNGGYTAMVAGPRLGSSSWA